MSVQRTRTRWFLVPKAADTAVEPKDVIGPNGGAQHAKLSLVTHVWVNRHECGVREAVCAELLLRNG